MLLRVEDDGEAKISDGAFPVALDQDVFGFDVAVRDLGLSLRTVDFLVKVLDSGAGGVCKQQSVSDGNGISLEFNVVA